MNRLLTKRLTGAVFFAAALVLGCTNGEQGPSGKDAPWKDYQGPVLTWLGPAGQTMLYADSYEFSAKLEDASAIDRVFFEIGDVPYIARQTNSDEAANTTTWSINFDFTEGWQNGPFVIRGVGFDEFGNRGTTPPYLLVLRRPVGLDTLDYSSAPGKTEPIFVPDSESIREDFDNDGTVDNQSFTISYPNNRFEFPADGALVGAEYYFITDNSSALFPDFRAILWRSSSEGFPGEAMDSVDVSAESILVDSWLRVDLSKLNNGEPFRFAKGERVHAGLNIIPDGNHPRNTKLVLKSTLMDHKEIKEDALQSEISFRHESPNNNNAITDRWRQFTVYEAKTTNNVTIYHPRILWIRLIVDYGTAD